MTQLHPNRMQLAEHGFNIYDVTPEERTPFEALLEPGYWAHVSMKFRHFDEIRVIAEDGSYYARLLVVGVDRLSAKVEVLSKVELKANTMEVIDLADLEVKWAGPRAKWRVIRKKDKAVLRDGFDNKDAGIGWAREHQKAVAA